MIFLLLQAFSVLAIIYGVATVVGVIAKYYKPIPVTKWSWKRIFFMAAYSFWGIGFILNGAVVFHPPIHKIAFLVFGAGCLLMVLTPCSDKTYNTDPAKKLLRTLAFSLAGVSLITLA